MREVLSLQYNAATASILATVAATRESEHVPGTFSRVLGVPDPAATVHIDELPPELRAGFDAVLAWLVPIVAEKHAAIVGSPEAMASKAIELAAREQEILEREQRLAALEAQLSTPAT